MRNKLNIRFVRFIRFIKYIKENSLNKIIISTITLVRELLEKSYK